MSTAIVQAGPAVRPARPALRVVPALAPVAPVTRPAPPLRLTPRGRLVVRSLVVLLGLLVTAAVVLGASRSAKADADAHPVEIGYHVVLPGETGERRRRPMERVGPDHFTGGGVHQPDCDDHLAVSRDHRTMHEVAHVQSSTQPTFLRPRRLALPPFDGPDDPDAGKGRQGTHQGLRQPDGKST